jgi:hypothetical protein
MNWVCTHMPAGGYGEPPYIDNCHMHGFYVEPDENGLIVTSPESPREFQVARLHRDTPVFDVVRQYGVEVWFDGARYSWDSPEVLAALKRGPRAVLAELGEE